jgi:uroporphyrinogen-III synthase/uroporphyrinogen III methyltransferase/synthase
MTCADRPDAAIEAVARAHGLDIEWIPAIETLPPEDPGPLDAAISGLAQYDWVLFTSAHTVDVVVGHPRWVQAGNARAGRRPRLAAVGSATAARLAEHHTMPDLVPDEHGGAALAASLIVLHGGPLAGARVLWPRSNIADRTLVERLRSAGAMVHEVEAYRTVAARAESFARLVEDIDAGRVYAVAFFSPSAASGLAAAAPGQTLSRLPGRTIVVSIGPTTSAALHRLGAPPDVEANPHTAAALVAAVGTYRAPAGRTSS